VRGGGHRGLPRRCGSRAAILAQGPARFEPELATEARKRERDGRRGRHWRACAPRASIEPDAARPGKAQRPSVRSQGPPSESTPCAALRFDPFSPGARTRSRALRSPACRSAPCSARAQAQTAPAAARAGRARRRSSWRAAPDQPSTLYASGAEVTTGWQEVWRPMCGTAPGAALAAGGSRGMAALLRRAPPRRVRSSSSTRRRPRRASTSCSTCRGTIPPGDG
jgi:hypothetical protein